MQLQSGPGSYDSGVLRWPLALLTTRSFKSLPHRYRNDRGDSSNSGEKTSAASLNEKATRDQQARPGLTGVGECCSTVRQRRRKR